MNKTDLVKSFAGYFGKVGFGLKKHSPEILVATGVVGVIASAVMACKATTKIGDILNKAKEEIEVIEKSEKDESLADKYSPEDAKKDKLIVYIQTGVKLVKLYGPAVSLGILSLSSILTSNNILRSRNAALAAAYATIDKSFKEYRSRVVEWFGKDIDNQLKYNLRKETIEKTVVDDKGKEKTVKEEISVTGYDGYSDYARFFDDGCEGWRKDSEYNLMFLRAQQAHATNKLIAQGYLFLNDVYEMLGIPPSKAGRTVGWIYNPKNPIGDNYVDFGIYEQERERARAFVNGYERTILLDFNVDGNILNHMDENLEVLKSYK